MSEKIEPLPHKILENMVAAGQIYWRKPPSFIPRKWALAFVVGVAVIIIMGVTAFPS